MMRFVVGIDMKCISQFKHEQEMLLFDQFIPVKSSKTFDQDSVETATEFVVDIYMTNDDHML